MEASRRRAVAAHAGGAEAEQAIVM